MIFIRLFSIFLCILSILSNPASAAGLPIPFDSTVVSHGVTHDKVVALTFDADMTPHMLRELRAHKFASWYNTDVIQVLTESQVPATLFLTGMWIETYATATRALSENPLFEIGNHSYSHGGFTHHCYTLKNVPEKQDISEVMKTEDLLTKYATMHVKLFRFPGI